MMRKRLWIIALAFAAIAAPTKLSAQITYTVNQTVGTGSATGYITTNGTIGTLSPSNIVGWTLELSDGINMVLLTPNNSSVSGFGPSELTATVNELSWDFTYNEELGSRLNFTAIPPNAIGELCFSFYCTPEPPVPGIISISDLDSDNAYVYSAEYGPVVIASVTHLTSGQSCNGTYTGTFNGNLSVSAGQNCIFVGGAVSGNVQQTAGNLTLIQSRVGGDLQVNGGGTFTIGPGTTIKGDLQIQSLPSGPGQNQVCGSTVNGNLEFQNNGTAVEIGSASPCAGNMIGGNLTVQNNTAATTVVGNAVTGNLQDQHNTVLTQVYSNMVGNNLQCQKNSSITGGGNTAKSKQGQCSAF